MTDKLDDISIDVRYRLTIEGEYTFRIEALEDLQKALDDVPERDLFDLDGPRGQIVKREIIRVELV